VYPETRGARAREASFTRPLTAGQVSVRSAHSTGSKIFLGRSPRVPRGVAGRGVAGRGLHELGAESACCKGCVAAEVTLSCFVCSSAVAVSDAHSLASLLGRPGEEATCPRAASGKTTSLIRKFAGPLSHPDLRDAGPQRQFFVEEELLCSFIVPSSRFTHGPPGGSTGLLCDM